MISIVIPAHDEANVIGRCLTTLTEGLAPGEAEVIVVCNGCRDATATIARSFEGVQVVETDVASKSHALNLGDERATAFPRVYLDADIRLTSSAARDLARALGPGGALAASPSMEVDLASCPFSVRAFYRVWTRLPYVTEGTIGAGVYAVSEAGRARFERFPDITADDEFLRLQFRPEERTVVRSSTFVLTPPRTLAGIVKVKTRGHFGNLELRAKYPEIVVNEHVEHGRELVRMLARPSLWVPLLVYAYVKVRTRIASHWKLRFGDPRQWERDDTSRAA